MNPSLTVFVVVEWVSSNFSCYDDASCIAGVFSSKGKAEEYIKSAKEERIWFSIEEFELDEPIVRTDDYGK